MGELTNSGGGGTERTETIPQTEHLEGQQTTTAVVTRRKSSKHHVFGHDHYNQREQQSRDAIDDRFPNRRR